MRLRRGRPEDVKEIVIAIDGPAGSGKSTTALLVARRLGYRYLAMYRAVALRCLEEGISFEDWARVTEAATKAEIDFLWEEESLRVTLDGCDVTDEIREPAVSDGASKIATISALREVLVERQREIGSGGGVVVEGRDVGTVVFPNAELKVYMDAGLDERARRRALQLASGGPVKDLDLVKTELKARDVRDSSRKAGPLSAAPDALHIDTTFLTVDEQVDVVVRMARDVLEGGPKR
jgi:cytidylate kinase